MFRSQEDILESCEGQSELVHVAIKRNCHKRLPYENCKPLSFQFISKKKKGGGESYKFIILRGLTEYINARYLITKKNIDVTFGYRGRMWS